MFRLIDKFIAPPTLDASKRPLIFRWADQALLVAEVIDTFTVTGQRWVHEKEKTFWPVKVKGGGLYDRWHDPSAGTWG